MITNNHMWGGNSNGCVGLRQQTKTNHSIDWEEVKVIEQESMEKD